MPDDGYEPVSRGYSEIIAKQNARIAGLDAKISSMDAGNAYIENGVLKEEQVILKKRIATLEVLIADAPHHEECSFGYAYDRTITHEADAALQPCNCWKSRALDTGAKG